MMEHLSFDLRDKVLALKKSPIPKPTGHEVLIKVAYAGICGTDIHILEGLFPCKADGPFTLGHEFTGTVEAIGPDVTVFQVGQRVAIDPNSGCNTCDFCHNGNYHFCQQGGIHNTIGIYRNGGWSTHALVPESQVFLVPDTIDLHQAALTEPLSCLVHGWDKINPVPVGSRVLVLGAGIIGLLWASTLHLHGLRKTVTVSEPQLRRREIVKRLGLDYAVKDPTELKGEEFDLIIDCSGSCFAMEAAIPLLARGGRLCVFGVSSPGAKMSIEPFQIYMKEMTIVGVNINPYTFLKGIALVEAMSNSYLQYEKLGIKMFSLSQYDSALQALEKGEISKAVFKL